MGPIARLLALFGSLLLAAFASSNALAQGWASTATKSMSLPGASLVGSLNPSTSLHVVVGLQERNADQVQPTLRAMLTPGNPLYGTSLTTDQFVAEFAPTSAQIQAVQSYLTSSGFTNVTVADNQLLIEADGTAAQAEAAFNTTLAQYSLNGTTVFANTSDAQVPASLAGTVAAVLGLNNLAALHSSFKNLQSGPATRLTAICPLHMPPLSLHPKQSSVARSYPRP